MTRTTGLLARFANVADRRAAACAVAAWLRAEEFLLFALDTRIGMLLPAAGLPRTIRGGPLWQAFLKSANAPGKQRAEVDYPLGAKRAALCWVTGDGLGFVVLGAGFDEQKLVALIAGSPLLAALLQAENATHVAEGRASVALEMGQRAHHLANALDTSRSALESALEESAHLNSELQQNDRRKDEFLAMLGHELRNPMAAISSALELMRLSEDEVTCRRARLVIDRQAGQLARLIDDLLDVSRVSQGKIVLRPTPISVAGVVQNAVETARGFIEARKHQLVVEAEASAHVSADPARLEQMVTNLLTNAAKYTNPGGHIRVSVRREGRDVVIGVEDDGIGIAPEMLGHVFDPFMQVAPSLDRRTGGLGMGLTLVKRLAELHAGRVEATSKRGSGSRFSLHLPAIEAPALAPDTSCVKSAATSRRILIVDDNVDAGEMLAELVKKWGHRPLHVADGPAALQAVAESRPDVVLLDIGLPGMDGYEVAARLRAAPDTRSLRIIALSGYGQEDDRKRSHAAGCDDHLVKPVSSTRLSHALEPQETAKGSWG